MRHRVPLLICALLLAAILGGAAPAGAQSDVDVEETRLEAQLQDDGDARWTVTATIPLEDQNEVDHFDSFATSFEQGERDFQLGTEAFREAADRAASASGRQMEIHSENREARIVRETGDGETTRYGELQVAFTWESFARIDENGTMHVDDAFNTSGGTWLRSLGEGQTLVIRSPPGYGAPSTAPIGAQEGDLQWEGPRTFEPGYFEIVYPPGASPLPWDLSTILLASAVVLSAAALLLGAYLLRRRDGRSDAGGDGAPATAREAADSGGANPEAEPVQAQAAAAGAADANDDERDLELLSDEERVEYLLERNGGRMKQANIVKETGWSNAKVSQLLSSMEDDERIDKLRIGRENLISLPGENVGDLAAGHDEE